MAPRGAAGHGREPAAGPPVLPRHRRPRRRARRRLAGQPRPNLRRAIPDWQHARRPGPCDFRWNGRSCNTFVSLWTGTAWSRPAGSPASAIRASTRCSAPRPPVPRRLQLDLAGGTTGGRRGRLYELDRQPGRRCRRRTRRETQAQDGFNDGFDVPNAGRPRRTRGPGDLAGVPLARRCPVHAATTAATPAGSTKTSTGQRHVRVTPA